MAAALLAGGSLASARLTKVLRKAGRGVSAQRIGVPTMTRLSIMQPSVIALVEGAYGDADGAAVVAHEVGQAAVGIDAAGSAAVEAERLAADGSRRHRCLPGLIFEGKAVLHPNAIVLLMEMDRQRLDTAPSPQAAVMVLETLASA